MKTLLVIYHSMTGATEQMAQAVARGASGERQVNVSLLHASQAGAADVISADAYVFATPENLAAISGLMKDFFDRTYYPALECISGRAYAAIVCAGSDGSNAVRQIERIATGWRLRSIAAPLIVCTHAQSSAEILAPKVLTQANLACGEELGATIAAGLAIGIF